MDSVVDFIFTRLKEQIYLIFLLLVVVFLGGSTKLDHDHHVEASYDFTFIKDQWLAMPDGIRLSVSYWIPKQKKAGEHFPVVLEVLPYRKDDSQYTFDYPLRSYFARRGIAYARVDLRGTGSSEGITPDREYSDQELADIPVIIDKLAHMPWSNGNIGMQGISWSAFNAIMTAMQQPPHLKGILVAHGSDDLYANDIHNIDGALHLDIFTAEIETDNILPRSPDYPVDEQYFRERFEQKPWIFAYLRHQRDGDFWQNRRSLQTDYSAIKVPVYAFAGLLDGYRDYAVHMLDKLKSPLKTAIGPQAHAWPGDDPGPRYEWRQIAARWWQQVLNGKDKGIWKDPKLIVFMRDYVPPDINLNETPGSYWGVNWPAAGAYSLRLALRNDGKLADGADSPGIHSLSYKASTGKGVLNWWGETTPDMREADEGTLLYDSEPLDKDIYILGNPAVTLRVAADAPLAHWVARLEDVNPEGKVSFVTGGLINGAQRESRTNPQAIIPGQDFIIKFPMHFTTWTFRAGHKIRLSVANAQFPMIWPTPYRMTTQLYVGDGQSEMTLPVVPESGQQIDGLTELEQSEPAPDATDLKTVYLPPFKVTRDKHGNTIATASEGYIMAIQGRLYKCAYKVTYKVNDANPAIASFIGEGEDSIHIVSNDRLVKVQTTIRINSDSRYFRTMVVRKIYENGRLLRTRKWDENIPRDFE